MFVLLYLQTRILPERWVGTSSDTGSQCLLSGFHCFTASRFFSLGKFLQNTHLKIVFSNLNYFKLESHFQAFIFKLHDFAVMQMHLCLWVLQLCLWSQGHVWQQPQPCSMDILELDVGLASCCCLGIGENTAQHCCACSRTSYPKFGCSSETSLSVGWGSKL